MAALFLVMFPPTSLSPLSLLYLHIISRKKAEPSVALSYPPTLVNHFYVGDDIIGVKRNFIFRHRLIIIKSNSSYSSTSFLCFNHFLHIIINIIFLHRLSYSLRNIFHVIIDVIFLWRHIVPSICCLVLALFFLPPCLFLLSSLLFLLPSCLFLSFGLFFLSFLFPLPFLLLF